ncbi:MAG TPA: hypothetical protein VFJ74_00050, partial [Gemmatimonadaceae bacterium]|nr:hypothetical protein [Gemmatimonadaceae bacterium]
MAGTVVAAPASGQGWEPRSSGTTAELRGLSVVNERVAWASGTGGHVARTPDGGATWRVDTIAGATGLDLRGVHGWNENVAWAMSAGPAEDGQARIYHTRDGGVTWTLQYSTREKGVFLDAIAFWDVHHGIAMSDPVGGRLFLLVTDDGGKHWKRVPPEGLPPMLPGEAAFAASGSCLVVEGARRAWIGTGGAATARVFRTT